MNAAQKNSEKITLEAEKREVFGKKLQPLRDAGKTPCNVYGKGFTSTAVSVDTKTFLKTFREAGETQVIYLNVGKDSLPVLVASIQQHPISDDVLHVDFKKIDLTQKTEAQVPVHVIGESPAVVSKVGDLLTLEDSVTVEALPDKIPSEIEIDISGLTEIDDAIKVSDITSTSDFTLVDDPEKIILKIAEHKEEDIEPDLSSEETVIEGEEPAEGDAEAAEESSSDEKASDEAAE